MNTDYGLLELLDGRTWTIDGEYLSSEFARARFPVESAVLEARSQISRANERARNGLDSHINQRLRECGVKKLADAIEDSKKEVEWGVRSDRITG